MVQGFYSFPFGTFFLITSPILARIHFLYSCRNVLDIEMTKIRSKKIQVMNRPHSYQYLKQHTVADRELPAFSVLRYHVTHTKRNIYDIII